VAAACALGTGCVGESEGSGGRTFATVTVFAASSLTDAFEQIGDAIESEAGLSFEFNFLASSDLAAQLEQGAPADVFASADETNMDRVGDAGLIESAPQTFARNRLEIIVAAGNPKGIERLEDLENDDLVVSLCNDQCPAGRYALEVFDNAGVEVEPDSLEAEVRAVVTRVSVGEADAGIVYESDVVAAGDEVAGVKIPAGDNVIASYPIAELKKAADGASEFLDYVLSPEGQEILRENGFLPR
jgi:molybdate transport system substrate-binding protein